MFTKFIYQFWYIFSEFFRFPICIIIPSANSDSFNSSFPIWNPFFLFFFFFFLVCLLWLGLPRLCWIKVVRVATLFFLMLKKLLPAFHTKYDAAYRFAIWGLVMMSYVPFIHILLSPFYHKWMLNLVRSFLCISWDDCMVFIFHLLMWCIILTDFWILNHTCNILDKSCLIMLCDSPNILLI